jgi:hypothetical protein
MLAEIARAIWPALVAALVHGALVGGGTCSSQAAGRLGHAGTALAVLLIAAGCAAAGLRLLSEAADFWLRAGLLLVLAYVAGCVIGCTLWRLVRPSSSGRTSSADGAGL